MANALITPTVIANEMMLQLENNLVWAKLVNRDYEDTYQKVGDTIQIRRPVKFTARTGASVSIQDIEEGNISLQLATQAGVDFSILSKDKTLTIDKFSERYIKPAAITLANQVDNAVAALALQVPNWVGTPGNTINSFSVFSRGPQRLDELGVPQEDRSFVLSPADYWGVLGSLSGLYVNEKAKTALERAKIGMLGGVDTYMSQNVQNLTTGTRGGSPLTNGAAQGVTYATAKSTWTQTLVLDGASNNITNWARAGDVFTIGTLASGVVDVSPVARANLGRLKQFTVMSAANSDGAGNVTLTISPPIITSGAQQTCALTAANTDNLAITFVGSAATAYPQSTIFHKTAFALAIRPLDIPDGAPPDARRVSNEGMSLRMIPYYDGATDVSNYRFDILYGVKTVYPELASRVSG